MSTARAWLPPTALTHAALRPQLVDVVAQWSTRWFGPAEISLSEIERTVQPLDDAPIVTAEDGCRASVTPRGKRAIIEAALAVDLAEVPLDDADRRLIDALAQRILPDLLNHVNSSELNASPEEQAWYKLTVFLGGADILALWLPEWLLIGTVKSACATADRDPLPLVARTRALGRTSLGVEGFLGKGSLSLRDLDTMAPGDVVVLDRFLSDGVALRLANTRTILVSGRLDSADDKPSLQF
jgi:hypothetical protein